MKKMYQVSKYYYLNCLRCILDDTAKTVSVTDCQSSNFCQGNIENIPYVFSPLRSRYPFFSFPIYLSLQYDLSQAITSFQMAKILQLFLYKDL